ncbi:MAG: EamA family transporter [Armatimonadota bacterium]
MNQTAILTALMTMLAWGSAAICDKFGMRGLSSPLMGVMVRLTVAFAGFWIVFLIRGDWRELRTIPSQNLLPLALGGILGAFLGQLAYFTAIKHADASRVVPFTASYPIVAMILAGLLLREPITLPKVIGTLMILGGLMLVSGAVGK